MNWKTIFIVGLGILSIVVLYYCYKRYYNEEGFQVEVRKIRTEIFNESSAPYVTNTFSGSIITLREIYSGIITFLTDYRNYSGYADAKMCTYKSKKYKENLTIVDFPYLITTPGTRNNQYWFPYTGQYGASPDWLTNFSEETNNRIDLDIYNNNLNRYISFIKNYSGSNRQKFIFNRSLVYPSLIYRGINLTQPPTLYNLKDASQNTIDINITEITQFTENYQSWYRNFMSYAIANKNIYPQSDYRGETQYRILYSGNANNDKPPNLTYSNINNSKKAGEIVSLIPDRRNDIIDEQLELNIYGGDITGDQYNAFKECMFLGSIFTNFDDQYNLDSILRVPYIGTEINGAKAYYSFNMFLPEFTYSKDSDDSYKFLPNNTYITYNSNLLKLRNNNTIKVLTYDDLIVDNEQFITNVNNVYQTKTFTEITTSNQAYVGLITREMMAKIPSLARRYITSWVYNRSRIYLDKHLDDVTGSAQLNSNELKKAQYICLAINNFTSEKLNNFLRIYAAHAAYTTPGGTFTTDATISNVPNENAAEKIVASSRIYNSYQYNPATLILSLSKSVTGGKVFNAGESNYFRNADRSKTITGDLITGLMVLLNNIGEAFTIFPTDGINDAKNIIGNSADSAKSSIEYVKSIMDNINSTFLSIGNYLNNNFIDQAMIIINELKRSINTETIPTALTISSITNNISTKIISIYVSSSTALSEYSIGEYISISGTTNFNGNYYKILGISSSGSNNIITISASKAVDSETPSAGVIKIYSLKRFLNEASSNINSLLANSMFLNPTDQNIISAKNHIIINEFFINYFNTNIRAFINSIKTVYESIDIVQMINKIVNISSIAIWNADKTYDINDYVKISITVYKCIKVNKNIPTSNNTYWLEITDNNIRNYINTSITNIATTKTNFTITINVDEINGLAISNMVQTRYNDLIVARNKNAVGSEKYREAQNAINEFMDRLPGYKIGESIRKSFLTAKKSLDALEIIVNNLKESIGVTGRIVDSVSAPTRQEIQTLKSDFDNIINNNKLLPDYGYLSNLNINDPSFLNSIAQLYYESSDGLYEMTTIYDIYMIGSNSIDIRFDKKQRLPKGRINNLNIQYLPEIQRYNRLFDIMNDGSWVNEYKDVKYTLNGQNLTSNAIDFYYEDLSAATNKLEAIFNPIYPVDQSINVKDLQIELSNLNTSNDLITRILTGKLKGTEIPYIGETPETVGYNYTDRLVTIQYGIQDNIYKIETQISGILQSCARVFVTPTYSAGKWTFPINGMAIGINAALTYNLAYNGNLEVDMANTQGNIGQYFPQIIYTKNFTPPIICGDIKFINKAAALFNQSAFLNLSSFTTQITGDDITKRQATETSEQFTTNINARRNNFYNSNDGPVYVDKILGFEQVNSNTCFYMWQETQYDPLTNGVFTSLDGVKKQRTISVQYQFMYDNLEYQNPRLIPDNNPRGTRPNEGFKYLTIPGEVRQPAVRFGDLYLSLYSWYASATRDLYNYLNELGNQYRNLYTPEYNMYVNNYNTQTSNISTLNHSTMALFSTNLVIANDFKTIFRNTSVINDLATGGTCDSLMIKPPIFSDNYNKITYNFRPGDGNGLTKYTNLNQISYTYNKYRTVDVKDFFSNIFNKVYRHDISKCDNALVDPENCFTEENDGCRYTYANTNSDVYRRIESNIIVREDIQNKISNTSNLIKTTSNNINALLSQQTQSLIQKNVVQAKGRITEDIYPEISNINKQITAVINNSNTTLNNIRTITNTYNTLLQTQTSDRNLPEYMRNQVIPITKPLPEEAYSLDNHYGQCPAYSCTSPVVMNSLVEQYNLNNEEPLYDDTIISILKGATPNSYQCDYLVEVRKKNAIVTDTNLEYDRIRFFPAKPIYSDNREAIYFPGNDHMELSSSCMNLDANNFTIDWFQYIILDDENPNPFIFSYGENDQYGNTRNLAVQFITNSSDKSIIKFILYINDTEFINNVDFNYNQLNRWTYFAIVRYNNVITCYKDGFAFVSKELSQEVINSLVMYIGSDGNRRSNTYFKGAICNFSFDNYDALYANNFFNTVPSYTNPIKNINTKFIIGIKNNIVDNIISRNILNPGQKTTIIANESQTINQTYLTNGTLLKEIFRGNNQDNNITIDPSNRIFISDTANHVIKVRGSDGKYTTVVGTGKFGKSSDVELLKASLNSPSGLCFGNTLYIADTGNNRICYVHVDNTLKELITGVTNISHIAYYSGYVYYVLIRGSSVTIARKNVITQPFTNTENYIILPSVSTPSGISFDNNGNLYIADSHPLNSCIYRVLSGTTTTQRLTLPGLNKPLSVTADLSKNLYIANSGDNKVYMAEYNINNDSYTLKHIAGDGTSATSFNEGYAKIIPLMPKRVLYYNNSLYLVDSGRICLVEKANIPNIPNSSAYVYYFSNNQLITSSLKIGSNRETDYKFNKNLFTIQWFMYMEDSTPHTIFTFENDASIDLGVTFDNSTTTTRMNLYINNQLTIIEFNKNEMVGLWVHIGIVHNGSTLSIYKNSILVYSLNSTSYSFNSRDTQLTIGNRLSPSAAQGFKGQLLSFMIYNKVARNYNNIIEPYKNENFICIPNLVLHLADGRNRIYDSSLTTMTIYSNNIIKIDSYPYSDNYNNFSINLKYSDNTSAVFNFNQGTYGITLKNYGYSDESATNLRSLGSKKIIRSFSIYSQTHDKSVQQWLLQGSSDNGSNWDSLHEQTTPYISRSSPIYPKTNTYSLQFPVTPKRNIGGDLVKMTKSFQVATLIEDCSIVITSNVSGTDLVPIYTKGVTSSNGFYIQENTPYINDTLGFQYIGNLFSDYESNVKSIYDPIISDSSNMLIKMKGAYEETRSDTYSAVGKLNTLNFYSRNFNTYDTLRTYIINTIQFRNAIFDAYSNSYSYMSNILRFSIVNSNSIDIVFDKVDLTGLTLETLPASFASRTITAGARYSLSVSPGFLDLTPTYLSNVTPFSNIFNDEFINLNNTRAITYKDRLNQIQKLVVGKRSIITTVTPSTLPETLSGTESLTGLSGIIGSNILPSPAINTVEYILSDASGTLPISKTNYIVQYVSQNEVNSVISATLDNTRFKVDISVINIATLINIFKAHFNTVYASNNSNGYPYNSVMKKVYKYSIVNKILYLSCSVEYTKLESTAETILIDYNKTPNITEFKTEVYYRTVFKTVREIVNTVPTDVTKVLAFEPCLPTAGGALTSYTDSDKLVIEGTVDKTDDVVRNEYKTNLLFTQITFIPKSLSYTTSYSITQIEFFKNNKTIRIDSVSINGGILDNYDLTMLIDGINPKLTQRSSITDGRIFTHTYDGGEISARFNKGTNIDGFSFMTGWVENNPQGWTVKGTADGITWVELINQDTVYNPLSGSTPLYISFYRTPIFSFLVNNSGDRIETTITEQPNIDRNILSRTYRQLRISKAKSSKSSRFQITNISLYNNKNLVVVNTATLDPTNTNRNLSYLFKESNLNNLNSVITYENNNNTSLIILFTASITFNGISFVSGIDVDKCMDMWTVEGSTTIGAENIVTWQVIFKQDYPYVNEKINYPHFFGRTPIFYDYNRSVELVQPILYDIQNWPISYVRFTPIYMYGENSSTEFEVSHFEFFKNGRRLQALNSSSNMNLITPYINTTPTSTNPETTINDLTIFRGTYQNDTINFQFTSPQNFNGFSFMSGPDITKCVQLWRLEVSTNGTFWVTVHLTPDNKPYSNENYPSSYYRLPHMSFFKNISIESNTQYYIISGTPTNTNNNGSIFKVKLLYSYVMEIPIIKFTSIIDGRIIQGVIANNEVYGITDNYVNWGGFLNSPIGNIETVSYKNLDFESFRTITGIPTTFYSLNLFPVKQKVGDATYYGLLDLSPTFDTTVPPIPVIYGGSKPAGRTTTPFYLYRDTKPTSGRVSDNGIEFDTIFVFYLDQLSIWRPPTRIQGFTNYKSNDYMNKFLLETNRTFNSELFRLIGSNNKVIPKKFYRVEVNNKVIIINLIANVEIIGYTITTGLYSNLSDATSWKVFGMKKNKWILLDKQDNYDIPIERSYTLPPFYFNSKKNNLTIKDKKNDLPDMKLIESYYTKKINPFGKAVFKKYMFDNNKTYYMVFDEYDNNRNLIDTDLIIGFVMGKEAVKKPVMYENPDGSFDAFNLKKKEMMAFWKKKIGLDLETKYLSDY